MWHALDIVFMVGHTTVVVFVVLGWTMRATRPWHLVACLLTAVSWVLLGMRYGFGYCFLTDWHWRVREQLGALELSLNHDYLGVLTVTQEFYDSLREGGSQSRIVNVASDAGRVGSMGEAVYAGAKGGVIAFTKSIARELARDRVPANCVCPGPTATALLAAQPDSMTEKLRNAIPFKRFAEADEIAGAVAFFASEDAEYITGQVLSVSGGLTFHG